MNPALKPLSELLKTERGQHRIPFFQRSYSWTTDRVIPFLDFIFEIAQVGPGPETNFIGFMVTEPPDRGTGLSCLKFQVIDGQQRMTTFSLILIGLSKICYERIEKLELIIKNLKNQNEIDNVNKFIELYKEQVEDIKYKYLENKIFKTTSYFEDRLKLVPQISDRNNYQKILEHASLADLKQSQLLDSYKAILSSLRRNLNGKDLETSYENFQKFLASAEELKVVQLELSPGDDPQKIFETINDKGLRLSTVDLIKNRIFTPSKEEAITEEMTIKWHEDYWRETIEVFNLIEFPNPGKEVGEFYDKIVFNYIRNILMRDGLYITTKGLNLHVKENYDSIEQRLTFLKSFTELYNQYITIVGLNNKITDKTINDENLKTSLKRLQKLEFEAATPFILKLFENKVPEADIANVVNILERYFIRRSICGENVKELPKIFIRICKEYRENFAASMTVSNWLIMVFKNDQLMNYDLRKYKFPSNDDVKRSLNTLNIYSKNRDMALYILLRLNEFIMKKEYPGVIDDLEVEHVLPQTLSSEWTEYLNLPSDSLKIMHNECLGLIGNLALTKSNQNMKNKLFDEKKVFLNASPYSLTRELGGPNFTSWKREDIINRNNFMIDCINKALPDLP
jgi:uncharacterized protein with ParB-like and HNH nuclease domain